MSDEQRLLWQQLFHEYTKVAETLSKQHFEPLLTRAREVESFSGARRYEALENLWKDRAKAVELLEAREREFFDQLATILAEPQLLGLEVARRDRKRTLNRFAFNYAFLPEARIDLIEIMSEMRLDEDEQRALLPVVSEYLETIGPVLEAAADTTVRMMVKIERITAQYSALQASGEPGWEIEGAKLLEERAQCQRQRLVRLKPLQEINRRFMPRIEAALAAEDAREFHETYLRLSYPDFYPDADNARGLFGQAYELSTLTDDQREALDVVATQFDSDYERVSRQMHNLVTDWKTLQLSQPATNIRQRQEFDEAIDRLKLDRKELNEKVARSIIALLTPEQAAALQSTNPPKDPGANR